MPELPEVETVRRVLEEQLIGQEIIDIKINYEKMILNDINYFISNIKNNKINSISRKGKFLIFKLKDINLVSHLRMEGKYFLKDHDMPILRHEHVIFYLSNGKTLRYHDTRKFGIMVLKTEEELFTTPPISMVASEPFNIKPIELYSKLSNKKIAIKTALLDQSIMAGLGNIYVDEVLFSTRINPHREANLVTLEECELIIKNSIEILNKAIKYGGTTIRSYTSSLNVKGSYQDYLLVHTKTKCSICSTDIVKDKTNGRGTYYCPKCQIR